MENHYQIATDILLERICERVAELVVDKLRAGDFEMIDQASSPLGRRRHIAFVRGGGGIQIGRRYLATKEAVDKHVKNVWENQRKKRQNDEEQLDSLAKEIGLERVK